MSKFDILAEIVGLAAELGWSVALSEDTADHIILGTDEAISQFDEVEYVVLSPDTQDKTYH